MKKNLIQLSLSVSIVLILSACGGSDSNDNNNGNSEVQSTSIEALGESLFREKSLSLNRTQACITCHNVEAGFMDNRKDVLAGAVSLGDDGTSIGVRNAPSAGYAALTPAFHFDATLSRYVGGQLHDGRASRLEDQAGGPQLNPLEMMMPNKEAVMDRIMENADYVAAFETLFGDDIFDDVNASYMAMTEAISSFERTPRFSTFDSKYDKYLKGEYTLSSEEELGEVLFFSNNNTNCNSCHQLNTQGSEKETFTSYIYENIGVPKNPDLNISIDHGLMQNPAIASLSNALDYDGKFKVPSLRNVAVTGPYMHNGVFKSLRTVVEFYDHFNTSNRVNNPETGNPWADAEVNATVNWGELVNGKEFDENKINALVAFMKILTDEKFEHLIP